MRTGATSDFHRRNQWKRRRVPNNLSLHNLRQSTADDICGRTGHIRSKHWVRHHQMARLGFETYGTD